MRKLQTKLFLLTFMLSLYFSVYSQEGGISQYMYNPQIYNPAAMSTRTNIYGSFLFRNQWVGMGGSPRFYALNINLPFNKINMGIGVYRTEIGVHRENKLLISYSYRLKVSENNYLSLGVSAGLFLQNREYSNVETSVGQDPLFMYDVKSKISPSVQMGVYYFSLKYYIGLAIPSLVRTNFEEEDNKIISNYSFDTKDFKLFLNGGYEYDINNIWSLNASTLVKYEENSPLEFDINTIFTWKNWIGAGLSYRTKKEWLILLNCRLNTYLSIGYSYQYTNIEYENLNSHELMLVFSLKTANIKRLNIHCPRF